MAGGRREKPIFDLGARQFTHFSLSLFASIPEIESSSLREDINALFRFIIYCLLRSGSDHVLKKMISEIAHASHTSSELSPAWYVEALNYLKNNHGITGVSGVETNSYIDDMINALS